MSLRVAIVDDRFGDADYVQKIVNVWALERKTPTRIQLFSSAEAFMFHYAEDKTWDVIFLDIEMGTMDGVTMAKKLRQENSVVQIVFITGFPDYISEGYDVAALHYLLKPVNKDKLFSVLDRAAEILKKAERVVLLPHGGEMLRLPASEVQYVEAFAHSVAIATAKETIFVKQSISEMEHLLGAEFVRCHRSYIVGIQHVSRLSRTEVILDNGKTLPLSRNAASLVHKAFVSYYTGDKDENI